MYLTFKSNKIKEKQKQAKYGYFVATIYVAYLVSLQHLA